MTTTRSPVHGVILDPEGDGAECRRCGLLQWWDEEQPFCADCGAPLPAECRVSGPAER